MTNPHVLGHDSTGQSHGILTHDSTGQSHGVSLTKAQTAPEWLPPYEGSDIIGYILRDAMRLQPEAQAIQSITKVRDFAIIVTDFAIYRAKPYDRTGWAVEKIAIL